MPVVCMHAYMSSRLHDRNGRPNNSREQGGSPSRTRPAFCAVVGRLVAGSKYQLVARCTQIEKETTRRDLPRRTIKKASDPGMGFWRARNEKGKTKTDHGEDERPKNKSDDTPQQLSDRTPVAPHPGPEYGSQVSCPAPDPSKRCWCWRRPCTTRTDPKPWPTH
jgi:hypothetical protein